MAQDIDWEAYLREVDARRRANMQQGRGGGGGLGGNLGQRGLSFGYKNIPLRKGPEGEWQSASDIVKQATQNVGKGLKSMLGGEPVASTPGAGTPFGADLSLKAPNVDLSALDVPVEYQLMPSQDFMTLPAESMVPADPFGLGASAATPVSAAPIAAPPVVGGGAGSIPAATLGVPTSFAGTIASGGGDPTAMMTSMAAKEAISPLTGGTGPLTQFMSPAQSVMQGSGLTGPLGVSSSLSASPTAALGNVAPGLTAAANTPGLPSGMVSGATELIASGGEATPEALMGAGTAALQGGGEALTGAGQAMMGGLSQIGTLLGGLFMSDEEQKKEKKRKDEEMRPFLDALKAYGFKYKNPEHGEGQKFGIMAQDLEKSKVGKALVKKTPIGKMVDIGQGVGTSLAALSYLHKRLKKLEGNANARR